MVAAVHAHNLSRHLSLSPLPPLSTSPLTPTLTLTQAYHPECLGEHAPPEDADEEQAWFCPPCAFQLGGG